MDDAKPGYTSKLLSSKLMFQAYEKVWFKSTLIIYAYTPKYVATKVCCLTK